MPRKKMTQKQALAILHKLVQSDYITMSYYDDSNKAMRSEVYKAFKVLIPAIHGKPQTIHQKICQQLCDLCYLRYADHYVEYYKDGASYISYDDCCRTCLEQLKTTQKIVEIDGKPYQPDEAASPVAVVPVERAS